MNQPRISMSSPSWSPLLPPSPSRPSGSSQCTSPEHPSHASSLSWWSVSPLIVYLFQCCSLRTFVFIVHLLDFRSFPGGAGLKDLLANSGHARDAGSIRGREDPLEEGMATHSSILAWRTPGTEESGWLQSKELDTTAHIYPLEFRKVICKS